MTTELAISALAWKGLTELFRWRGWEETHGGLLESGADAITDLLDGSRLLGLAGLVGEHVESLVEAG